MKDLLKIIPVLFVVGMLGACDYLCPKCELEHVPQEESPAEADDASALPSNAVSVPTKCYFLKDDGSLGEIALVLTSRGWETRADGQAAASISSFGTWVFTDGSTPGVNTSITFDGTVLNYLAIGIDAAGGKFKGTPYAMPNIHGSAPDHGIEINLARTTIGGITYDLLQVAQTISGPYTDQRAVTLANQVDGRATKGGSGTGGNAKWVGVNDGRNIATYNGFGTMGNLDFTDATKKVRLHYSNAGSAPTMIISSSTAPVPAPTNYCKWTLGITCWGADFDKCLTSCR